MHLAHVSLDGAVDKKRKQNSIGVLEILSISLYKFLLEDFLRIAIPNSSSHNDSFFLALASFRLPLSGICAI